MKNPKSLVCLVPKSYETTPSQMMHYQSKCNLEGADDHLPGPDDHPCLKVGKASLLSHCATNKINLKNSELIDFSIKAQLPPKRTFIIEFSPSQNQSSANS